jgi:hypothetical protein
MVVNRVALRSPRGIGADGILLLENPSNHADFECATLRMEESRNVREWRALLRTFCKQGGNGGGPGITSFETPVGVISAELAGDLVTCK